MRHVREIQASSQTSVKVEAQPKPPEPTETDSPAGEPRFTAAACQVNSGHAPFAVLDSADCYHVVQGSSSRSLEEAQQLAELLNAWEADEEADWPLGLS